MSQDFTSLPAIKKAAGDLTAGPAYSYAGWPGFGWVGATPPDPSGGADALRQAVGESALASRERKRHQLNAKVRHLVFSGACLGLWDEPEDTCTRLGHRRCDGAGRVGLTTCSRPLSASTSANAATSLPMVSWNGRTGQTSNAPSRTEAGKAFGWNALVLSADQGRTGRRTGQPTLYVTRVKSSPKRATCRGWTTSAPPGGRAWPATSSCATETPRCSWPLAATNSPD